MIHAEELLTRLEPDLRVLPSRHIVHGMVSSEVDGELSSSKGTAQLVDELLDELAARPEVRALAREGEPLLGADDLVAIAVLGFCLDKPVHKGLAMPSVDALPRPRPQHRLARSRWRGRRRGTRRNDGAPDPAPDDPAYRHIVLQASPPSQPRGRARGARPAEVRALCRPPRAAGTSTARTTRASAA